MGVVEVLLVAGALVLGYAFGARRPVVTANAFSNLVVIATVLLCASVVVGSTT